MHIMQIDGDGKPSQNPKSIAQRIYGEIIDNGRLPTEDDIATAEDKIFFYEQGDQGRTRQATRAARLKLHSGRGKFDGNGLPIDMVDELSDEMIKQDGRKERDSNIKSRASKPIHDMVMELKKRTEDLQAIEGKGHNLSQDDLDAIFDAVECAIERRSNFFAYETSELPDCLGEALWEPQSPEVAEIVKNSEYLSGMIGKIQRHSFQLKSGAVDYHYTVSDDPYKNLFPACSCHVYRDEQGITAVIEEIGGERRYTAFSDRVGSKAYEKACLFTLRRPTIWKRFSDFMNLRNSVTLDNEENWIEGDEK